MPFKNRIRLPFYVSRPQFPMERSSTRKADGSTKIQSVIIRKVYEGQTDDLTEGLHQKLAIALSHDIVKIEGDRYFGNVALDSEYNIEWQEFLDYPLGKADFKVQVTPFDATNSNCKTCDEAQQVALVDDLFPEDLEEGETYTMNVFANDTIECLPLTATVVTFNPTFIASASIDDTGVLTVQTTAEYQSANGMKLLTYRVTCPNGGFDEADVYGNLSGSIEACLAPLNVRVDQADGDSITYKWDLPDPLPGVGWEYTIAKESSPGSIITSGSRLPGATEITFLQLEPSTRYLFSIRAKCDDDRYSQWVNKVGVTANIPQTCGKYKASIVDNGGNTLTVTWIACNGEMEDAFVFGSKTFCALETSPGNPVSITAPHHTIEYLGPCE